MGELERLTAADLDGAPHGFFTRRGGVSGGIYASLQCGYGATDDPRDNVDENRGRVAAALGVAGVASHIQTHSARAIAFDADDPPDWPRRSDQEADAIVVDRPGVAVGVLSADCAPVLFWDRAAGVVGAAHAGWRGALGGVLEAAVALMIEKGAARDRIAAAVGPTIGPDAYEVGVDFRDRFVADDAANARFFTAEHAPGKTRFDLPSYVVARLAADGVAASWIGACTYADADRFYSNRRAVHRGEGDYGRMLSAIAVPEAH